MFFKQYKQLGWFIPCAVVISVCSIEQAKAAAFANADITAAGAAAANAVVAGADDISAAFYNPSGLAWQEGVQAMFSNQARYRNMSVDIGGVSYEGEIKQGTVSSFAISWLPKGGNIGVSASAATTYSVKADWSSAFPTLGGINLNMKRYSTDAFWRVNNTLGLGVGLDIYDTSLSMSSGGSSFSGSEWSDIGLHLSSRWEFMPFWTLGVVYRQGAKANVSSKSGAKAYMTLPDELTVALAHDLMDDEMRMELAIKRSGWSSFQDLNVVDNGVTTQSLAVNMRDTTDVMLGLTWFWRDNTQLRFGYAYEQGANEMNGYQPMFADLTGHRISAGFGGMMSGMHLDITWSGVVYPNQTATGAYAGRYDDARYSLMLSLSKKF